MAVEVVSEREILREAETVLVKHLGLAKTARVWAAWRQGAGNYLEIRERLFEGETVETLYEKVQQYEKMSAD
jgi:hypothetical protein